MPQSAHRQCSLTPIIVLLGGPGSGKGTHGQALATALGYKHLSSGEHFREHIRRKTPLGLRAGEYIEKGQLAPDKLATELVTVMLADNPSASGIVLDGYPRSLAQAETLDAIAPGLDCSVNRTLYLTVSDDEIVRRLSGRLTCRQCGSTCHETLKPPAQPGVCDACGGELFSRTDDEPATIRERVAVFHNSIGSLLEFYRTTGRLEEIPAEGQVHDVSARVIAKSKS